MTKPSTCHTLSYLRDTPLFWLADFAARSTSSAGTYRVSMSRSRPAPGPLVLADLSTAGGAPGITTDVIDEISRRWVTYAAELGTMRWAIIPDGEWDKARRFECEVEGSNIRPMVFNEPWLAWGGSESTSRLLVRS